MYFHKNIESDTKLGTFYIIRLLTFEIFSKKAYYVILKSNFYNK
jgi:hypothetical protein